jgi:hypothetical protein
MAPRHRDTHAHVIAYTLIHTHTYTNTLIHTIYIYKHRHTQS